MSTVFSVTSVRFPYHVITECGVTPSLQVKGDSFPFSSITLTAKYTLSPLTNSLITALLVVTVFTSSSRLPSNLEI